MAEYSIKEEKGTTFFFEDCAAHPSIRFEVVHKDGTIAWHGLCRADADGRKISGLRLRASNMAKRYEAYLKETGKRFELERRQKREIEEERLEKAKRIVELEVALPTLQAELEELLANLEPEDERLVNEARLLAAQEKVPRKWVVSLDPKEHRTPAERNFLSNLRIG
ncbi:MAG: hypothetical protein ABSH41_01415 [Syntrophobacteraceae bacterium]